MEATSSLMMADHIEKQIALCSQLYSASSPDCRMTRPHYSLEKQSFGSSWEPIFQVPSPFVFARRILLLQVAPQVIQFFSASQYTQ